MTRTSAAGRGHCDEVLTGTARLPRSYLQHLLPPFLPPPHSSVENLEFLFLWWSTALPRKEVHFITISLRFVVCCKLWEAAILTWKDGVGIKLLCQCPTLAPQQQNGWLVCFLGPLPLTTSFQHGARADRFPFSERPDLFVLWCNENEPSKLHLGFEIFEICLVTELWRCVLVLRCLYVAYKTLESVYQLTRYRLTRVRSATRVP